MGTINFNKDDFASLGLQEFLGQWNQVALEDLNTREQEFMSLFIQYCCNFDDSNVNTSDVLLVKAGDYGMLRDVYGPSIFRTEDGGLVLKAGSNEFPVVHKSGQEFTVGALEGTITFASEPIKAKVKKDNEEYEVEFQPAVMELLPNDGAEWQFNVKCSLDPSTEISSAKIKQALKRGESIAHHFRSVPKKGEGGGNTLKMQELGKGEFAIGWVRSVETQNGTRYIIGLEDGTECWSRGNVETVLKDDESRTTIENALAESKPVTLSITNVMQKGDKWYVDCALRFRAPRVLEEIKPGANKRKPAPQTAAAQAGNKVLATAAAAGKKVLTAAVADEDSIPF